MYIINGDKLNVLNHFNSQLNCPIYFQLLLAVDMLRPSNCVLLLVVYICIYLQFQVCIQICFLCLSASICGRYFNWRRLKLINMQSSNNYLLSKKVDLYDWEKTKLEMYLSLIQLVLSIITTCITLR